MSTILYAQPNNIEAEGFYFRSADEYAKQSENLKDRHGNAVEEFEIQFIDGEAIDAELATAWHLSQGNFASFFEAVDAWDETEKFTVIVAVTEGGYILDTNHPDPQSFDVQPFELHSLKDLAVTFVEDGVLGDIPKHLQFYIDYDAFARDLAVDYSETIIAGKRLVYRCV